MYNNEMYIIICTQKMLRNTDIKTLQILKHGRQDHDNHDMKIVPFRFS